jgi:hypothetical protein
MIGVEDRRGATSVERGGSTPEATGELPAVGTEVAGRVEPGILFADDDVANTAGVSDEVARSLLEGSLRREEVGHEDGSTGSLFHDAKAIGLEI